MSESWSVSNSVDEAGNLYVVWADFRNNTNQACTGSALTATPPCDNDVFYSVRPTRVRPGASRGSSLRASTARFGETAQWQPWSGVTPDGTRLWIAFYDRSYGDCESTGCNDITMAEVDEPGGAASDVSSTRA